MNTFGVLTAQRDARLRDECEALRLRVRQLLEAALHELMPGGRVLVFGSLCTLGRYTLQSDVDLGFEVLPARCSPYALAASLEERVGRPVDLVDLAHCRFADKLRREGQWWTT